MWQTIEWFWKIVRRAPKTFLVSTAFSHFSNMVRGQCWTLNPFQKTYWYLDKSSFMKGVIWNASVLHYLSRFVNFLQNIINTYFGEIEILWIKCVSNSWYTWMITKLRYGFEMRCILLKNWYLCISESPSVLVH